MIRKADVGDVDMIYRLIQPYVIQKVLLPRSKQQIQKEIDLTWVSFDGPKVQGSVSLIPFSHWLYEIRAFVVDERCQGLGIGRSLMMRIEKYIKLQWVLPIRIFALTYRTEFFIKNGFQIVRKEKFSQKIYDVCQYCTQKNDCQEIAVEKIIKR